MARRHARIGWLPVPDPLKAARATDTLIVSDVHLGLKTSRPDSLLDTLGRWRFQRLVLLGDILHDDGFRRFCLDSWRLVGFIRELAVRRLAEVVWIQGNHDRHLAPLVASLVGIEVRDSYAWSSSGRRFLAVHGDGFDRFVSRHQRFGRAVGRLYSFCQHRLSRRGEWPGRLDRLHARLADLDRVVAEGAASFARGRGADVIVCGHTHAAASREFAGAPGERAVHYVNAGSWVQRPASFLTVDAHGVRINHCP